MLYSTNPEVQTYPIAPEAVVYHFSCLPVVYISDGHLTDASVLDVFTPSSGEKEKLLQDYTSWCERLNQPQDEDILKTLSA